jgi:hypothetical protein
MLQPSEVLPGSVRLPDALGNDGKFAVESSLPEVDRFIHSGNNSGLFLGVTGCGKSRILPAQCAELLSKEQRWGKLLVLTTAAKGVAVLERIPGDDREEPTEGPPFRPSRSRAEHADGAGDEGRAQNSS